MGRLVDMVKLHGFAREADLGREADIWHSKLTWDYSQGKMNYPEYKRQQNELKKEYQEAIMELRQRGLVKIGSLPPVGQPNTVYVKFNSVPPAPPHPVLPVEQSFGEISAFRVWRVVRASIEKHLLRSVYTETIWQPGEVLQSHVEPEDFDENAIIGIYTGIHAWKSVFEVGKYIEANVNSGFANGVTWPTPAEQLEWFIIGRVHLWGKVVEHARGYRAQFAKIISLDDCQRWEKNKSRFMEQYNISRNRMERISTGASLFWDGDMLQQMNEIYLPRGSGKSQSQSTSQEDQ